MINMIKTVGKYEKLCRNYDVSPSIKHRSIMIQQQVRENQEPSSSWGYYNVYIAMQDTNWAQENPTLVKCVSNMFF